MQGKEKGYNIFLTEKEDNLIAACTTIAAIVARIPKVFDTVQLDTHTHPADAARWYAEAQLAIMNNQREFVDLVQKLSNATSESPLQCLCGNCQMTEQSCRHKRVGPAKPRPIERFCPPEMTEDMYLISGKELGKLQITHEQFSETYPTLTAISEQVLFNVLTRGKIIWSEPR